MYRTLLVPTDGSDGANRAVEHALDLAEHYGATVHAMFVVDSTRYGDTALSTTALVTEEVADEGEELLRDIADRGENMGVDVVTRCCHGRPAEEILGYASEVDADLVVLGYSGQRHDTHLGSTVDRVARACERPVLLA
jgi:nucleotide-binding universal stress UspA family protein